MIAENINSSRIRPKILVVPLDWGLGHATRCIPIIKTLMQQSDVVLAAETHVVILLQREFPDLKILPLQGYRIRYSSKKKLFALKILQQLPRIFSIIRYERRWLKKIIAEQNIQAVISDNRPGLYNKDIRSVYITHQLSIQSGNRIINKLLQKIHYHFINKFNSCWIPDNKTGALAGVLSHPGKLPETNVEYLGLLSRCKKSDPQKIYDFGLLLSGPEPQRTLLEKILIQQFESTSLTFIIIRGLPGRDERLDLNSRKAVIYNHLAAGELCKIMQQCDTVIARAGYSTIMDLVTLKQKAVLIPTPGQTEQEYLARYLGEKKLFITAEQESFSLDHVIKELKAWQPDFSSIDHSFNEAVINNWLKTIGHKQ